MKHRKYAVSPVIATLLLILIAIAAGVVVYAYVLGFVGQSTTSSPVGQAQLSIDQADLKSAAAAAGNIQVFVRNVGGVPAKVQNVYVLAPDGTIIFTFYLSASESTTLVTSPGSFARTINPGSAARFATDATVSTTSLSVGSIYVVQVVATDGSATSYSTRAHA